MLRMQDFFRDSRTGAGIPGRTVSVRRAGDNVEIATAQTDANGKFGLTISDIEWPGPIYYMVDDGSGTYKRHSGQSFGQVGPVWFDALVRMAAGLGKGVMSGLSVSADGSGMKVTVAPGLAIAKDGIPFYLDSAEDVTITASDGTHPRIDLIVLRVTRAGQALEGKFEFVAIAGTPAGSPAAPSKVANSANDDIVLAEVLVDASTSVIASGKVTDRRFIAGQEVLTAPLRGAVIESQGITATQLADDAVETAKIDDGAVTDAKVAAGIDAAKIANGSVSNTEFQYIGTVTSDVQDQLDDKVDSATYAVDMAGKVDTSTYTSDMAGKSATTHTHTQHPTLFGKATRAHSSPVTVNTSSVDVCNFNLGPLVNGVTYDVIAEGSGQANAASGGTVTGYVRIQAGGTPEAGYGTATVGGERQIGAAHSEAIVGAGSTINISFRAQSTNSGASVNGALVWAIAIPRNVPAS